MVISSQTVSRQKLRKIVRYFGLAQKGISYTWSPRYFLILCVRRADPIQAKGFPCAVCLPLEYQPSCPDDPWQCRISLKGEPRRPALRMMSDGKSKILRCRNDQKSFEGCSERSQARNLTNTAQLTATVSPAKSIGQRPERRNSPIRLKRG